LRNTFWWKEKDYALLKCSLHPLKHNKLHKAPLMLAKDKLKTLNQVSMIKIRTMSMVVIFHQVVIKIKLKMKSKLKLMSELVMKVKARTKTMVMTKWLLKNLLNKLKLTML
jgi:NADH dehydrogenase FAD-containing subunit